MVAALIAGTVLAAPFYLSHKEVTPDGTVLRAINTHDMAQHLAVMEQFDKVLRSGVLYPRWLPDVNKGYGLAWTNFYPPGFYYLTSLVNLAVRDWMKTLFLVSALGFGCVRPHVLSAGAPVLRDVSQRCCRAPLYDGSLPCSGSLLAGSDAGVRWIHSCSVDYLLRI